MLGRLRIRQKLAVLLAIPLTAVALVMALLSTERIADSRAYAGTVEVALGARDIGGLIQTLQRERLLALGYLAVPTLQRSAIVGQTQTSIALTARLAADPRTAEIIRRATPQLQPLDGVRARVVNRNITPREAYDAYVSAILALTQWLGLSNPEASDAQGIRDLLALDSLMRSNEEASSAGAIVVGAAVDPAFTSDMLTSVVNADLSYLVRFRALASAEQVLLVNNVYVGNAATRLRKYVVTMTRGEALSSEEVSDALTAALTYTGLRRLAQDRVARDTALSSQHAADTANLTAGLVAGGAVLLFLVVVALAVTVSRSISRPLQRLGRAVGAVAELSRAELVRVADSESNDTAPPELTSVEVDSKDEIGDLAAAVNRVQSTAAMLLERQVTARANVATMFANVSRRTQNLVGRQLHMIEEILRDSKDAGVRARLDQLEHVTTRLRRSADSLLVLSGTIDQQLSTMPARLTDIFDAALIEIEGSNNVEVVQPVPDVAVPADLASDLRLLLAELLENATNFTPPGASVRLGAARDARGGALAPDLTIAIVDHGLGMSPARMDEENHRLVERERLDVVPTRVLGLFVVGRLARRHGLSVRLEPSPGRGITATVRVPARVLAPGSAPAAGTALGVVPPLAAAALESATRSGPFAWLEARPAIGTAAVPPGPAPARGAPVPVGRASAPTPGAKAGTRRARDPEAERDALNQYLSGAERGAQESAGAAPPAPYVLPEYIPPDPAPPEIRTTPAERHQ